MLLRPWGEGCWMQSGAWKKKRFGMLVAFLHLRSTSKDCRAQHGLQWSHRQTVLTSSAVVGGQNMRRVFWGGFLHKGHQCDASSSSGDLRQFKVRVQPRGRLRLLVRVDARSRASNRNRVSKSHLTALRINILSRLVGRSTT
jgi:hypothetical protein